MMSASHNSLLRGRTIVVVGPAGNLGPIWCKTILESGGTVIGLGINVTDDIELKVLGDEFPNRLRLFEHDVRGEFSAELVQYFLENKSSGIVFNAGIDSTPGSGFSKITDYDFHNWIEVLSVNVAGIAHTLNKIAYALEPDSSVIFIGSMYGVVAPNPYLYAHFNGGEGSVKNPAYGASKAALISLCNQYAIQFAHKSIRFNLLTLGGIEGEQDIEFKEKFKTLVPLQRMGGSLEIKNALRFLLSSDSSYMTGHNLILDGGFTTW